MTECCRRYGISRETGHKLWRRFREQGDAGLLPRPRVAKRRPHTLDSELAYRLLELRRHRPSWGPLKLLSYMARHNPELKLPAPSTVGELLKREGLVPSTQASGCVMPIRLASSAATSAPTPCGVQTTRVSFAVATAGCVTR